MKNLASLLAFCLIVVIAKSQTPNLSTLVRFVNTPVADLTEEVIALDGWELAKSEVVDSVATLHFTYDNGSLIVKKVRKYKNEIFLVCNKLTYDNLNKSLLQLKPELIDSKVNENGHVVKTYQGETYGYKISIAPKSVFIVQVYDKADALKKEVLEISPPRMGTNEDMYIQESGFGETPFPLRKFTNLVMPQDDGEQMGKIAVRIRVDKDGKVLEATPGVKGTTLNNRELWQKCKIAIIAAKLTTSAAAPSVQTGVVVFNFRIR